MYKIGTHNSATGESSYGILSWLGIPFSRCQGKTIKEQYDSGCRYFDIRVKYTKRGWVCAHGLWESKRDLIDILNQINSYGDCYIMITYEGEAPDSFLDLIDSNIVKNYSNITFTSINVKKPVWKCLKTYNSIPVVSKFKNLDGSSWHTYLPIPWLWKKIYYNNPEFNEEYYTLVDFL